MVIALPVVYAYTVSTDWVSDVSHDPDFLDHVRIEGPVTLDYIISSPSDLTPPSQHCGPPPALKLFSHQKALPPPSLLSLLPLVPSTLSTHTNPPNLFKHKDLFTSQTTPTKPKRPQTLPKREPRERHHRHSQERFFERVCEK